MLKHVFAVCLEGRKACPSCATKAFHRPWFQVNGSSERMFENRRSARLSLHIRASTISLHVYGNSDFQGTISRAPFLFCSCWFAVKLHNGYITSFCATTMGRCRLCAKTHNLRNYYPQHLCRFSAKCIGGTESRVLRTGS